MKKWFILGLGFLTINASAVFQPGVPRPVDTGSTQKVLDQGQLSVGELAQITRYRVDGSDKELVDLTFIHKDQRKVVRLPRGKGNADNLCEQRLDSFTLGNQYAINIIDFGPADCAHGKEFRVEIRIQEQSPDGKVLRQVIYGANPQAVFTIQSEPGL